MENKVQCYQKIITDLTNILAEERDLIAKMSTISAILYERFSTFDWVGFYRLVGDKMLKVGPYCGSVACTNISIDRGICGRCATTQKVQLIDDVHKISYHIACSSSTNSEIVLPVFNERREIVAVLDVDSNQFSAFDKFDEEYLSKICQKFFTAL